MDNKMYQYGSLGFDPTGKYNSCSSVGLIVNEKELEKIIPQIRITVVEGRELIPNVINQYNIDYRDGSLFESANLPPREIKVGFMVWAKDSEEFRDIFNKLNLILRTEDNSECWIRFKDEMDKSYRAILNNIEVQEPKSNNIRCSVSYLCSDPYKYSAIRKGISIETEQFNYLPVSWEKIELNIKTDLNKIVVKNKRTGNNIILNGLYKTGQKLIIDNDRITLNGQNITNQLDFVESEYHNFNLKNRDELIVNGADYIIFYRERWL